MHKLRPIALAFFLSISAGCSALGPHPQDSQPPTPKTIRTPTPVPKVTLDPATAAVALAQTAGIQLLGVPSPTVPIEKQAPPAMASLDPSRLLTATPFLGPPLPAFHFESQACAIAFDVPAGWEVGGYDYELYPDAECSLGIRPPGWQDIVEGSEVFLNDYPILAVTYSLPLEKAAQFALFVQEDASWFITGRGIDEAQLLQVDGRTILRGVGWYGVYTKANSSYAGLNTVTRAVLSEDPSFSAVVQCEYMPIDGPITLEEAFELIVRTFTLPQMDK